MTIVRALRADAGSLLVFLPGAAEIRRTETFLRERDLRSIDRRRGALRRARSRRRRTGRSRRRAPGRRKVVLATSIAETSLTIEGVRVVIDCGLARVPRYEPDVGLTRLETVRVSRASADQRRGRAGRTEPGVCYRLWDEPQTASLEPANRPEILAADLSGFVLDLAHWGVADPASLAFLDPPPPPALAEAKALLGELGAIDREGRITEEGRRLRNLPLPPRLARMVVDAAAVGEADARRRDRGRAHRARARRQRCRSRASPRCVAARAFAPRAGCARRWRSGGREIARGAAGGVRSRTGTVARRPARARLSRPHRQEPRRRRRLSARERPRRECRSGLGAVARAFPRRCRDQPERPRRAASCWRRR